MGKIFSISNQKGGTSKSSSAVNLGAALKMKGKKVLIVDLDPQGDASTYLGYEEESSETISQMMERFVRGESIDLHDIIQVSEKNDGVAVSAAKNTSAKVYAVELYDKAYSYLERNIIENKADVTAVKGDALDAALLSGQTFSVITANPPYLTRREMDELQREVRYEPETALFGGDDGLDFYRRLIPLWSGRLEKKGVLAFEVGNGQAEAVKSLLENETLRTEILPDFQGIGRVVFGRKM